MWRDQIKRKPGKLAKAKGAQLAGQSVMTLAQTRYTILSTHTTDCVLSSIIVYYLVSFSCTNLYCTNFDAHDARTALDDCSSKSE